MVARGEQASCTTLTSSRTLLLQSFADRRRMVSAGVSSRMLCMLLYFKLHASSVIVNSSELPYWASLDNSSDAALVAPVFFGHSLQQWM